MTTHPTHGTCRACPDATDATDANDDGKVDLADAAFVIDWRYRGSPPPPDPFQGCSPDPTPEESSCMATAQCR